MIYKKQHQAEVLGHIINFCCWDRVKVAAYQVINMALEIQNSGEQNKRIIEEVQNIVQQDKRTVQNLQTRSVSLEQKVHEAFIKKPRSNIQEQANIKDEQANKLNETACICIWITIIAIIIAIIIIVVYFTTNLSSNTLDSFTN